MVAGLVILVSGIAPNAADAAEARTERRSSSSFGAFARDKRTASNSGPRTPRRGRPTRAQATAPAAQTAPPRQRTTQGSELVYRDGTWCVALSPAPPEWNTEDSYAAFGRFTQNVSEALALGNAQPICPGDEADAPTAAPAPQADAVLAMLWEQHIDLPSPTLSAGPSRAITGLPAFLEIGGDQRQTHRFSPAQALGYAFVIEVDSTYDIDWGDGQVDRGIASQGGPWPHGDVAHNYQHTNRANVITVTQRWTASWTATGWGTTETGTIDELWTTATLPLPVWEVQAVLE